MARIVAGYDGSTGAEAALRWAAAEADLRGALLELVWCWQFPLLPPPTTIGSIYDEVTENLVASMDHGLLQARDLVAKEHGTVEVRTTMIEGHPASTLISAADGAEMLVVGSNGHGAFSGLLLGSVSLHCVTHAPCPVVVVRPASPRPVSTARPVTEGDLP